MLAEASVVTMAQQIKTVIQKQTSSTDIARKDFMIPPTHDVDISSGKMLCSAGILQFCACQTHGTQVPHFSVEVQ